MKVYKYVKDNGHIYHILVSRHHIRREIGNRTATYIDKESTISYDPSEWIHSSPYYNDATLLHKNMAVVREAPINFYVIRVTKDCQINTIPI